MPLNLSFTVQDKSEIVFRYIGISVEVKEDPNMPKGSGKEVFRNVLKVVIGNRACDVQAVSEPLLGVASEDFLQARFGANNTGTIYGLDQAFPFLLLGQNFPPLNQQGSKNLDGTSQWVCTGPWVSVNWTNPGTAFPNIVVSDTKATELEFGPIGFASAIRYKTVGRTTTDEEEYRHVFNVTVKRRLYKIAGAVIPEQGIHTQNFIEASFQGSDNRRINSLARVGQAFPYPFQMMRQEFQLDTEEGVEVYNEVRQFASIGPWATLDWT